MQFNPRILFIVILTGWFKSLPEAASFSYSVDGTTLLNRISELELH